MDLGTFQYYFQLKLPHADIVPGGLIALLTRGGLKQPTEDTLEKVIRLNGYFDELHGRGTSTKETKNTLTKTNKFLVRRCPDIDEKLVKAFAKVKYTKKIKDMYEEILMKRRLAAKFKGKKLKSNRDHLKDGHLRCQSKLPEMKLDTEFFYDTMYGSEEKSTEMEGRGAEEVETINKQPPEVVEVAVEETEVVEVPQDVPEVPHDAAEVAEVRHNADEEAARGEDCEKTGARRAEEDEQVVAAAPIE